MQTVLSLSAPAAHSCSRCCKPSPTTVQGLGIGKATYSGYWTLQTSVSVHSPSACPTIAACHKVAESLYDTSLSLHHYKRGHKYIKCLVLVVISRQSLRLCIYKRSMHVLTGCFNRGRSCLCAVQLHVLAQSLCLWLHDWQAQAHCVLGLQLLSLCSRPVRSAWMSTVMRQRHYLRQCTIRYILGSIRAPLWCYYTLGQR